MRINFVPSLVVVPLRSFFETTDHAPFAFTHSESVSLLQKRQQQQKSKQVRLKDHGTELIEVADNGSGVKRSDRPALALKHHTSKLRSFLDLDRGPSSFGFRGEALSSLCAVAAEVAIVTRCDDDDDEEDGEEGAEGGGDIGNGNGGGWR